MKRSWKCEEMLMMILEKDVCFTGRGVSLYRFLEGAPTNLDQKKQKRETGSLWAGGAG